MVKYAIKQSNILTKHKRYANMQSIMTQKTKTTTKKSTTKPAAKVATQQSLAARLAKDEKQLAKDKVLLAEADERIVEMTIGEDTRNAVLIVSVLINMFIFITWLMLQVTTQYDYVVSSFIFGR